MGLALRVGGGPQLATSISNRDPKKEDIKANPKCIM